MVFKLIITGISCFSLGVGTGILIIYFLCGRSFFNFMKVERKNFCIEMDSNTKEIHDDMKLKVLVTKSQNLLEEKGENLDGKEE